MDLSFYCRKSFTKGTLQNFSKMDNLEVILRQMDSTDHPVMVDMKTTAAELQLKKLNLLVAA